MTRKYANLGTADLQAVHERVRPSYLGSGHPGLETDGMPDGLRQRDFATNLLYRLFVASENVRFS
jgi:hypothetical protein